MATGSGHLAVVTGTSAGLGAAVARQLLDRGWHVVGCARRESTILHREYSHHTLDLAELGALEAWGKGTLVRLLADPAWRRIALVNNAASADLFGTALFPDPSALHRVFAVNTVAPMWLMALFGRHVPSGKPLRIVNVSTGAAAHPLPGLAAYGSSKAALRHAGAVFAAEWSSSVPHAPTRSDVGILSYEPGVVDTAMQDDARSASLETMPWRARFEEFATRRLLVPPDVPAADIVAFLQGDPAAPFVEGRLAPPRR